MPHGNELYSYFLVHIAEDMKNKMILPIRRAAGLGDNFFFNNRTVSMNSSLKGEVEKSKNASSHGKSSKCSYIADGFVSRYRCNIHRAVVVLTNWHPGLSMLQLQKILMETCHRKGGQQKSVPLTQWDPKN